MRTFRRSASGRCNVHFHLYGNRGIGPYSWSIVSGPLPAGLSLSAPTNSSITIAGTPSVAGRYFYTVQVWDALAAVTQTYSGTVVSPSLSVSTASLIFSAPLGTVARSQQLTVSSNPAGMAYSAAAAPGCLWVHLSGATGTTNGTISVSADGTLFSVPGTYNCNVAVTPADGGPAQNVYVSFLITGVNLHTSPSSLTFTYATAETPPGAQSFAITADSGAAVRFTAGAGCSWVSLSPAAGTALET